MEYAANDEKTFMKTGSPRFQAMGNVIQYIEESEKTNDTHYLSGINCVPEYAHDEFIRTKKMWDKQDGIQCYHAMQSFAPGEADPDTVHKIGIRLAEMMWGNRFEVIVATHLDKEHLHNHFVINSVSFLDGGKYHRSIGEKERLRNTSDVLCREHGLSVVEPEQKANERKQLQAIGVTPPPVHKKSRAYRALIRTDINQLVRESNSLNELYAQLERRGYDIKQNVEHVAVKAPGMKRYARLRSLGDAFTPEALSARIARNKQIRIYRVSKKLSPSRRRRLPAPWLVRQFRFYYFRLSKMTSWRDELIQQYGKATVDYEAVKQIENYSATIRTLCKYQFKNIEQVNTFVQKQLGTEKERRILCNVMQKNKRREERVNEQNDGLHII